MTRFNLTETFNANEQDWKTDLDTLKLMRQFRSDGNEKMVAFVFHAGCAAGRIIPA